MKQILVSVVISVFIVFLALIFTSRPDNSVVQEEKVYFENSVQVVELSAKGGYSPRKSIAKAGVPTMVRFVTSGTFDCSSFVRIPSLNIQRALPQTGKTDIDIGVQQVGLFRGSCSMGMYPFEIEFK